jgi:hypothetical protein
MKSKLIALSFLALAAVLFTGCGSKNETMTTTTTREQSATYSQ